VDWGAVEALQRRCFERGGTLHRAEIKLLQKALRSDVSRYRAFAERLRKEHAQRFVSG
jgi:hypothetical protein